jgi:uncharacterized membrane protein
VTVGRRFGDDRGAVTAFTTVFTVAVIFVFGLVFDGGRMLAAQRQADNEAAGAARAAAQAITVDRSAGQVSQVLDMGLAQTYVCAYAGQIGRGCGAFQVESARGGTAVTVRVSRDVRPLVLPLTRRSLEGEATACTEIGLDDPIIGCG